nr:hypothetical protein [uncultured Albidiferax sp.]
MSQGNGPRIVCVVCLAVEVHLYDLSCMQCRPKLEQMGLLDPAEPDPTPTKLIQIGPLDI